MEQAALEPLLGKLGEEPFDGIEPRGRGRGEMEYPTRMPLQPRDDLRGLVSSVVIQDGMDLFARGNLSLDGVKEANELLMPMMLHAAADNAALQHVQRGEQRGGAVSDVVMLVWTAADGIDVPE